MIFRRFALVIGLLFAGLASQLPEFTQQYRQRLGGAIDELTAIIAQFDQQAAALSLDRDQAIARLKANPDVLAQGRGNSLADTVTRRERLETQRRSFSTAGPLSAYAVLAEDFDPGLARQTYADFQPAVPVTPAGMVAGLFGLLLGWLLAHALAMPIRLHRARTITATAAR